MSNASEQEEHSTQEPVNAPGRNEMPVENRPGADTSTGSSKYLSWGARSDVGLVREHNEDSFLVRAPLFCVCDGMGGHEAGEVASKIAVDTIGTLAPEGADDVALGAAVEQANAAVLEGANTGQGKPGMGCTATCVLIEGNHMAVAHVGDSRVYLLHAGTLVRVTHDHSYVEELVDAGEITADEARLHPSRSIITRALGSDPDMYADHFTVDVVSGDRIIICSDGLSSMVPDKDIEALAVSSATPQAAANNLTSAALTAGGHDNVTVVVVDVVKDGLAEAHRARRHRAVKAWILVALAAVIAVFGFSVGMARNNWYVGNNDGTVAVYRGLNSYMLNFPLYKLVDTSSVQISDLPEATQHQLDSGIRVEDEQDGKRTIEQYRDQIDADKTRAAQAAAEAQSEQGQGNNASSNDQSAPAESGDAAPSEAAANGEAAAQAAEANAVAEVESSQPSQSASTDQSNQESGE